VKEKFISLGILILITFCHLDAQQVGKDSLLRIDKLSTGPISCGWADEAVSIGYVTAPSVIALMFVSALINEWNAGYAGIPASAMILAAPPLIFAGGRSVELSREISHPRARLGWTLYALSIVPTSFALYGFTTEEGAYLPLIIASGILGSASIIAMTSYAFSRATSAREMDQKEYSALSLGISPLTGGAMATVVWRF
jgi:hypothetical protein